VKYITVAISDFYEWYEEKLLAKYSVALEGVKKRFYGIF
jgi:hypothetical protein